MGMVMRSRLVKRAVRRWSAVASLRCLPSQVVGYGPSSTTYVKRPTTAQRSEWRGVMAFGGSVSRAIGIAGIAMASLGAQQQTPPLTPDIPRRFVAPTEAYDYLKREVMIPMRDGVKLH